MTFRELVRRKQDSPASRLSCVDQYEKFTVYTVHVWDGKADLPSVMFVSVRTLSQMEFQTPPEPRATKIVRRSLGSFFDFLEREFRKPQ